VALPRYPPWAVGPRGRDLPSAGPPAGGAPGCLRPWPSRRGGFTRRVASRNWPRSEIRAANSPCTVQAPRVSPGSRSTALGAGPSSPPRSQVWPAPRPGRPGSRSGWRRGLHWWQPRYRCARATRDIPAWLRPQPCEPYSAGTNLASFTCTMTMESTSRPLWSSAVRL
jgi:hypothetical protein